MSERAPAYPGYGNPCNGCGLCCAAEPCQLAADHIGALEGPCPAMQFEGGRFICGLVKNPSRYLGTFAEGDELLGGMMAKLLGVGRGCDSEGPMPAPVDSRER